MPAVSPVSRLPGQLEIRRAELPTDDHFVQRCQDGLFGPLASEVAADVAARETVDGHEPSPAQVADAVIAELRQIAHDARRAAA